MQYERRRAERRYDCGDARVSSDTGAGPIEVETASDSGQVAIAPFHRLVEWQYAVSSSGESLRSGVDPSPAHRRLVTLFGLLALLLVAGCATPVAGERADPQSVHRELTGNVLSTGELSDFTQNVLRLGGIAEAAENDPEAALAILHEAVVIGFAGPNAMFAYAELALKAPRRAAGARTTWLRRFSPGFRVPVPGRRK